MRYELLAIFAVFLLLAGCAGTPEQTSPPGEEPVEITNFEECAAAGYPVMESYPRQCALPDGTTFTEELAPADEELPDSFEDVELTINENEWLEDLDALENWTN